MTARERAAEYSVYISFFGLFLLFGALALRSLDVADLPDWAPLGLAVVGGVLLLAWPALNPREVGALLAGRRARYGGNSLILSLSVIGILAVVNFLGTRWYVAQDVTANQRYSISRQTRQIIDDLETQGQAVNVTAIVRRGDPAEDGLDRLIDQYRAHSKTVTFEKLDPQVEPIQYQTIAQRIGEDPPSRGILAEADGNHAVVFSSFDEQSITEAIVKATREEERVVKFTTGHEEYSPDGGERSYAALKDALEREGVSVETVNLSVMTDTLAADAVVVAGPRRPFLPEEAEALVEYARSGGALLVLLDPQSDAGLSELLTLYGIRMRDDLVLDPQSGFLGSIDVPAVTGDGYRFHTLTKDLTDSGLITVFPGARSIDDSADPLAESVTTTPLIQTSDASWGETDFDGLATGDIVKDEGDAEGPLTLAVSAEGAATEGGEDAASYGRLVVFGSAAMVSDGFLGGLQGLSLGNGNLVLNAVNWLTQDEALISIRPTEPDTRPISPPQNPLLLFISTTLLMPALVAGIGFWVWWRQR